MKNRHFLAYAGFMLLVPAAFASDGITTDGSMGVTETLTGTHVTVPQSLGTTSGTNLYHSFTEFNIAPGQTVEFTGSDALQNVL